MNKWSEIFSRSTFSGIVTRERDVILNCVPAYDITHVDADGHVTILNPSPRVLDPWHPNFDAKSKS